MESATPLPMASPPEQELSPRMQPHRTMSITHTASDAVLPRGSSVRITGNNRTKGDLVGREGLVQGAQQLGGWHEVLLDDGFTVRVQRNALLLLSAPSPNQSQMLASPPLAPANVLPRPSYGIPMHKTIKRKVKKEGDRKIHANIAKLNVSSLKKYRRHYNLNISKDCTRDELVGAVRKHFAKTKVDESEVISNFLRYVARGGSAAND